MAKLFRKSDEAIAALPAALKTACTTGDLSETEVLYNNLVSTDASCKSQVLYPMAILAAKNDHPSILSFCFSKGLTLNPDHVNDPLVYAATGSGSIKVHQVLLENGMDVNKYLELEGSPLVSACEAGNFELVRFLLAQGADPNNGYFMDYEALIWAIVGSHASLEIVKLLLGHGTLVKGTGALIAAAENGNLGATKLLLEHGDRTGDLDLEEVEEWGTWTDRKNDQGTALYVAAREGHEDIVDVLREKGADPGFRDRIGRTAADVAEERGHRDLAKKLR